MNTRALLRQVSVPYRLTLLLLLPLACPAATPEATVIGRMIEARGDISARSGDNAARARKLLTGSDILAGETIVTGSDGFGRMRMPDNSIISLAGDTRLMLEQYRYDGPGAEADSASLKLLHGRVQSTAGAIGESQSDSYQLETPFGVLHSAGADFECAQLAELYCSVTRHGARFSNQAGSLALGTSGSFDYLEATAAAAMAVGLLYEPPMLQNLSTLPQSSNFTPGPQTDMDTPAQTATPPGSPNPNFPAPNPITVTPVKR